MQNDKSPGNDGLAKEFYETFWNELKEIFIDSVSETEKRAFKYISKTGYHQVNRKKDKDKIFIQNWRPISLKIISKALSEKLKKSLPDLISTKQTAYLKDRHIGEGGRLISGIIKIARLKKLKDFLVTVYIEKAFDSLDYNFLISTLQIYGFGKKFYLMGKGVTERSRFVCY